MMTPSEQLERYVEWNKCTRHQLIVAHMISVRDIEAACEKLRRAMDAPYVGLTQLVDMAVERLSKS